MNVKILVLIAVLMLGGYQVWKKIRLGDGKEALIIFVCQTDAVSRYSEAVGTIDGSASIGDSIKNVQAGMQAVRQVVQAQPPEAVSELRKLAALKDKEKINEFAEGAYGRVSSRCPDKVSNKMNTLVVMGLVIGMARN